VSDASPVKNKQQIFSACEHMGEAAVLSDLERSGATFAAEDRWLAWEWVYAQRLKREKETGEAVRSTARQTLYVAVGTAVVALFTAAMAITAFLSKGSVP